MMVETKNTWTLPWNISTKLKHMFHLKTILFSHPANADPSFSHFCTPQSEDEVFGSYTDAYHFLDHATEDILAIANPEYDKSGSEMVNCIKALAQKRDSHSHAFRVVLIIPYDNGRENQRLCRELGVTEISIYEKNTFAFWPGEWWKNNKITRGTANFRVGFIMFENEKARRQFPISKEIEKKIGNINFDEITTHAQPTFTDLYEIIAENLAMKSDYDWITLKEAAISGIVPSKIVRQWKNHIGQKNENILHQRLASLPILLMKSRLKGKPHLQIEHKTKIKTKLPRKHLSNRSDEIQPKGKRKILKLLKITEEFQIVERKTGMTPKKHIKLSDERRRRQNLEDNSKKALPVKRCELHNPIACHENFIEKRVKSRKEKDDKFESEWAQYISTLETKEKNIIRNGEPIIEITQHGNDKEWSDYVQERHPFNEKPIFLNAMIFIEQNEIVENAWTREIERKHHAVSSKENRSKHVRIKLENDEEENWNIEKSAKT